MPSLFQLSQFVFRIEIWGIPSNMTLGLVSEHMAHSEGTCQIRDWVP